jgi:hypothetical protein
MKAELLEANHIYYVVISHANSRTKSLIDFNGHLTLANQFIELVNKACKVCGGLGGLHGEVFHGKSDGFGSVEGSYSRCPNQES